MKLLLLIAIIALSPLPVLSQGRTTERIISVPFSQLSSGHADGSTRIVINGTAGTPCTAGPSQVLAVKLNGVWTCTDLTAGGSSGGAPINATFITQTPNSTLTAEQALSILASGILKGNTGTGVVTIAVPGTDYLAPAGNGSQLTSLNASQLTSGTMPDARFPATLPVLSGVNLTALNASNLASGTVGHARLGTGGGGATKFLREDNTWQTIGGGGDALVANPLSQFANTTSAQLASVINDETGTNKLVFSDNAILSTPNLGTPSVIVLTNATGIAANLTAGTATVANAGDSATAFFATGTVEAVRGGTGLGIPTDDQLIVGNGTAFDFKTLPACSNATNDKLLYSSTTNTFSCGADQTTGAGSGITTLNTLTGAVQTFSKTDDTNVTLTLTPSGTDHNFALGWAGTLADSRVADNITLTNITQITNRAISDITGDLAASRVDDGGVAATQALFSGAGSAAGFRAIVDADVPNTITIDLATLATTAVTANAGDSATAFFITGTIEAVRLPDLSGLNGAVTDAQVPNTITVDLAATVTTNANLTGPITSTGNATNVTSQTGTGSTFAMQAGPTFTGTPTLPTGTIAVTQTAGNSTTAVATTAFVTTADNLKANLASPTFTGTVTFPTPFTLGAVSVLPTGTELNFVDGVTSAIQTQLNSKVATGAITSSGLTMATARLLGRTTASTGAVEEITVGSGLALAAGVLTATGSGSGDMLLGTNQTVTARKLFNPATLVIGNVATPPTPELGSLFVDTDDGKLYYGIDGSTHGEVFVSGLSVVNLASANVTGILPAANILATVTNSRCLRVNGSGVLEVHSADCGSATIANGTSALGTSAISSGACATVVTTTATGTATTDVVGWGFNSDPTGVTGYAPTVNGMLTIIAYPSSNNVNFKVCNNTSASVTPGAVTLNWRIVR